MKARINERIVLDINIPDEVESRAELEEITFTLQKIQKMYPEEIKVESDVEEFQPARRKYRKRKRTKGKTFSSMDDNEIRDYVKRWKNSDREDRRSIAAELDYKNYASVEAIIRLMEQRIRNREPLIRTRAKNNTTWQGKGNGRAGFSMGRPFSEWEQIIKGYRKLKLNADKQAYLKRHNIKSIKNKRPSEVLARAVGALRKAGWSV